MTAASRVNSAQGRRSLVVWRSDQDPLFGRIGKVDPLPCQRRLMPDVEEMMLPVPPRETNRTNSVTDLDAASVCFSQIFEIVVVLSARNKTASLMLPLTNRRDEGRGKYARTSPSLKRLPLPSTSVCSKCFCSSNISCQPIQFSAF